MQLDIIQELYYTVEAEEYGLGYTVKAENFTLGIVLNSVPLGRRIVMVAFQQLGGSITFGTV